jgi:hypothetical protein
LTIRDDNGSLKRGDSDMLPENFSAEQGTELLDSTATDVITAARLRKKGDWEWSVKSIFSESDG